MTRNKLLNESTLCKSCGLCCEGLLHNVAHLLPEEILLAKSLSLEIFTHGDFISFKLPCGCLKEMCCSVYPQRPQGCAQYRCQLLRCLQNNEISLSSALEKVTKTRGIFEDIQARLPEADSKRIWQRIGESWDFSDRQSLLASGELDLNTYMEIITLAVLLEKYFYTPEEKKSDGG